MASGMARMIKSIIAAATRSQKPAYCSAEETARDAAEDAAGEKSGAGDCVAARPTEKPTSGAPQELQNGFPSAVFAPHAVQVMVPLKIKGSLISVVEKHRRCE
jgi:hypothetical protein